MDHSGNLFLRWDKTDAIDDIWTIIDKGDAIHLKIKIEAYPAKKEIAMKNLSEILQFIFTLSENYKNEKKMNLSTFYSLLKLIFYKINYTIF